MTRPLIFSSIGQRDLHDWSINEICAFGKINWHFWAIRRLKMNSRNRIGFYWSFVLCKISSSRLLSWIQIKTSEHIINLEFAQRIKFVFNLKSENFFIWAKAWKLESVKTFSIPIHNWCRGNFQKVYQLTFCWQHYRLRILNSCEWFRILCVQGFWKYKIRSKRREWNLNWFQWCDIWGITD